MPDLERLEDEIVRAVTLPPPDYIEHEPDPQPRVTAADLGRITAEAIKQAHDTLVKSLEELGKEITARVERIEEIKAVSMQQLEEVKELMEQHRDSGKLLSAQVESTAADLSEARGLIEAMRNKLKA